MKNSRFAAGCLGNLMWLALGAGSAQAAYVRTTPMFDIPQNQRPEWGTGWCAPTAVGNSFAWLAAEYGLDRLVTAPGTGARMSAADVINELGVVDMKTDPTKGTAMMAIDQAKKDYIKRHGLEDQITVESAVSLSRANAAGEYLDYTGTRPSAKWLMDQLLAGQDVEVAVGYFDVVQNSDGNRVLKRHGGHLRVGDVPGLDVGGHSVSLVNLIDLDESRADGSYKMVFTDPGRDDLAGQFGALSADQYFLTDPAGVIYFNTASTYQVVYDPDLFGLGFDAYILDGYMGEGSFVTGGAVIRTLPIIEAAWAESPIRRGISEPASLALAALGLAALGFSRRKRSANGFSRNGWAPPRQCQPPQTSAARRCRISNAGKVLPSSTSRKAPPPVLM